MCSKGVLRRLFGRHDLESCCWLRAVTSSNLPSAAPQTFASRQ